MTILSAIVARTDNYVIGRDNQMPWHMPADLKHFKRITMGKPIVMGRRTFESIGRPLPGRDNIILSRQAGLTIPGVRVVSSMQNVLSTYDTSEEVFIIGGGQIFEQYLPDCNRLYVTEIHMHIDDGDVLFPQESPVDWKEIKRDDYKADDKNPYDYSFITLERVN